MTVMIPQSVGNTETSPHIVGNLRIQIRAVRNLCGNVSSMTIYRWLNDPAMTFPKPIYIGRRRYWKEADVLAWLEAREGRA